MKKPTPPKPKKPKASKKKPEGIFTRNAKALIRAHGGDPAKRKGKRG